MPLLSSSTKAFRAKSAVFKSRGREAKVWNAEEVRTDLAAWGTAHIASC